MTARFWEISRFVALGVPIISCHILMARCFQRLFLVDFSFSFLHFTLQDENQEEEQRRPPPWTTYNLSFLPTRKKEFCKCCNWNCEEGNFQNVCHFFFLPSTNSDWSVWPKLCTFSVCAKVIVLGEANSTRNIILLPPTFLSHLVNLKLACFSCHLSCLPL